MIHRTFFLVVTVVAGLVVAAGAASAHPHVWVTMHTELIYTPDGTLLGRILTGVPTANVAFGEDGATLFITANHSVLRMRTKTRGMPLPAAH